MKNLIDYAENYKETFVNSPFNEVDGLVLAQLCYLNFDSYAILINTVGITIKELFENKNKSLFNIRVPEQNKKLLRNLANNPRFSNVRITNYEKENDANKIMQFSATTFEWDKLAYVAFRGTDSTVVGWKEDFDAMFKEAVPSQLKAVEYLEKRSLVLPETFYVGGHSKGGNMAIYSVLNVSPKIQDRVAFIFDYDGPGVRKEYLDKDCYLRIKDRIITTIPEQSLFGMILYNDDNYQVIKSDGIWLYQHDPFNWHVVDGCFVYLENVAKFSAINRDTLNRWLYETDAKSRELLVDTVYKLITLTNSEKVGEVPVNLMKNAAVIYKEYKNLNKDELNQIFEVIRQFKLFRAEIENATEKEGTHKTEESADFTKILQKIATPIKTFVDKIPIEGYKEMLGNTTVVKKTKKATNKINDAVTQQFTKMSKKADDKTKLIEQNVKKELAIKKRNGIYTSKTSVTKSKRYKKTGYKPLKSKPLKYNGIEQEKASIDKTKAKQVKPKSTVKTKKNVRALQQTKRFKEQYFDFYDDVKDHTKGKEDW